MDNKAELLSVSVTRGTRIIDALETLNRSGVGLLLLVDAAGALERTVTDGDIRRLLLGGASTDDTLARLAPQLPLTLQPGWTRRSALLLMNQHGINHVPVVDPSGCAVAIVERRAIDDVIHLSAPHMGV